MQSNILLDYIGSWQLERLGAVDFHFIFLFVILWHSCYVTCDTNLCNMSQSVVQFGTEPLLMNSDIRLNVKYVFHYICIQG